MNTEKIPAKKSLGQHFLKNESVINKIIELGDFSAADQILEIGPGPGALTSILRTLDCQKLWLLEKDDVFARNHAQYAEENKLGHMRVFHTDALTFPWRDLRGNWKIIGNLPYNVASPLMWDIVSQVPKLSKAVFMIQKEVAERIRAKEGNKTYGALSAWIQSFCKVEKGFVIRPSAFTPPPKVDSEIIIFKPLPEEELPKHPEYLATLIKTAFQQRRKQLHGIFQKAFPSQYAETIWQQMEIPKESRAETLSPKQFQKLADLLFPIK